MKSLIDGMRECQKNSKGKPGYIWAAGHPNSNNVEVQFDNVKQGKANIFDDAWVPWYTMHKLIAGIIDVYNATGYSTAKDLGSDLGDWVYNRCKTWDANKQRTVLSIEYGGMNDFMYDLYLVTGKDSHAVYAEAFWNMVITHHTYITGGNSEWEHFGMDDILDKERTNCNCETCNSYNMLKLSRELYKI